MNSDKLLNIYRQLEDMEQTKEVADELQAEFGQAIDLIEIQKKFNG